MGTDEAMYVLHNTAWLGTNEHAERVCEAVRAVEKAIIDYKDCRNELCLKCGKYTDSYRGSCKGCRWNIEVRND